jgi:hypothetical protein
MFVNQTLKVVGFPWRHAASRICQYAPVTRDLSFAQLVDEGSDLLDVGLW